MAPLTNEEKAKRAAEAELLKKNEEELAAKLAAENGANQGANPGDQVEPTDEELKAESDRVQAELAKKDAEKKELAAKRNAVQSPNGEQMYSKDDVKSMILEALKKAGMYKKSEDGSDDDDDEEDAYKQKTLRLPRFQGKFIHSFKNMNNDEYFPDLTIHAVDIWNDQKKANEPWVTCIFEDGSELTVQLYTVLTKSKPVEFDIVEVTKIDTSYKAGKIERIEVDGYSTKGTGKMMNIKVTQYHYGFKVREKGNPEAPVFEVSKDVINWN
jgi:hypothetical protein